MSLLLAVLAAAVSCGWAQPRDASSCPIVLGERDCESHCDCNRAACTLLALSQDDVCECEAGYGGPTCDDDVNECLTAPCGEHGARCAESTGGPIMPVPCGECQMLGMTQCSPSGACVPHGSCPPSLTDQLACEYIAVGSYQCSCPAGWSGTKCEVFDDCASSPCQNGAACLDASRVPDACSSVAGVANCSASYHCECTTGFAGPLCEHDIDECAAAPCAAPKQCIDSNSVTEAEVLQVYGDVAPGEYLCVCPAGFSGPDCALNIDECMIDGEVVCLNGAACRDQTASVLCTCAAGYIGAARFDMYGQLQQPGCATEVDECTQDFGAIDRAVAIFAAIVEREPTEVERGEINACGFRRLCIDEIAAYRCPVVDCNGTLDGGLEFDACRVCDGDNSTCTGCDGVPVLDERARKRLDRCGVCDGDGLSCLGCDGTPNSGLHFDSCGVCGGDNSTCIGCDNIPNSGRVIDACGVCGGDDVCRRTITVAEPLTFAAGVSAATIQASIAAMLAVPMSEIDVEITAIAQKVEQSLNLRGTAGDFGNASHGILREGFVTMLALHQREVGIEELGAPVGLEDVIILAVRDALGRRRLDLGGTDTRRRQTKIKAQSDTSTAGRATATWRPPPPAKFRMRTLQADVSSETEGDTVWIDYSVSARRDISAAFEPDVLVPGFVAAVNSLNSSAVPRLDNGSVFAAPPAVQTNVSFSVKIPEARAETADEAEDMLSTNPQSLVVLVSLGPCSISPCQNGGTCHETIEAAFRCECVSEWGGELCETEPPSPPAPPPDLPAGSVVATLSLEGELMLVAGEEASSRREVFLTNFKIDIATALLGVEPSQVIVISVTAGSVVVEFAITPSDDGVAVKPAALEEAFGTIVALPLLGVTTVRPVAGVDVPVPQAEPSGLQNVGAADDDVVADPSTDRLPMVILIGAGAAALLLLPIMLAICVCCWRHRTPRESKEDRKAREAMEMAAAASKAYKLTGEAEDIEMPKVQETKKKPVARARRPSISDTLKAGRTQGADARTKAKNQQKLKQTQQKAGKAKSKRPGGAPAKKNASKGKKTLAETVDDEDLKAAFDGRETKKVDKKAEARLRKQKEKAQRDGDMAPTLPGAAAAASGSHGAISEKAKPKKRRRGSVMEAGADGGGTESKGRPADSKPKPRRRRGSVEEDKCSDHSRSHGHENDRGKATETIVPQHNDGMLRQAKSKQGRARRGSVTEVKIDLMALKKEEEAKAGGGRKQDSKIMQRRRRRGSVNELGQ